MAVRMTKPWRPLVAAEVARLPGQLGVWQIAEGDGQVVCIGMAGGRSLFGLRGELERERAARDPDATGHLQFRIEVTMSYLTRCQELLMAHVADHGELPRDNRDRLPFTLGRLHPA